jgi:hypothetical protein
MPPFGSRAGSSGCYLCAVTPVLVRRRRSLGASSTSSALFVGSALVVGFALGCGDDEPRVPVHVPNDPGADPRAEAPFEPRRGESFASGTQQVSVEGVAIPDAALAHALLVLDLDADGDRDALLLRSDPSAGTVGVSVAIREGAAFRVRAPSPLPLEGCTVRSATLAHPTRSSFVAEVHTECAASAGVNATPERRTHRWILSNEPAPRVRLVTSARGEAALSFAFEDLDADEHEDVSATVSVAGRELALRWLDRPGGLALDADEPAASVRAAMSESRELGASLARALCRGEAASLRVGPGSWGLDCPEELLGAARVAETDAWLRAGRLDEALLAIEGGAVASAEALDAAAAPGITATRLAFAYRGEPSLDVAHVALAFVASSEGPPALRVEGASIDRVARDGSASPGDALPAPIRSSDDPPWVLTRVRSRGCAVDVTLASFRDGTLGGVHELVDPTACTEDARSTEWRALGWAPQGILVARLGERRVLPITTEGLAAGTPVPLEVDAPWPAPALGARITPDGSAWILERREGVFHVRDGRASLWRPSGWSEGEPPSAAAISPDGREVAVLRGDAIWLLSAP